MTDDARKDAYKADITYGTASEFGFDFLRDRLKLKSGSNQAVPFWAAWTSNGRPRRKIEIPKVQREHHYALVDEADNVFVDEARTPLIIGMPSRPATEPEQVVYHWADSLAEENGAQRALLSRRKEAKGGVDRPWAGNWPAIPIRRSAHTRTPWTNCMSTSNEPCKPITVSASINII